MASEMGHLHASGQKPSAGAFISLSGIHLHMLRVSGLPGGDKDSYRAPVTYTSPYKHLRTR